MKYVYIDKNGEISIDHKAKELIYQNNHSAYVNVENGIISVPEERWLIAQQAESNNWVKNFWLSDDRNFYHYRNFDYYNSIKNHLFGSAIELVCGPFTNLRIIGNFCKINKATLLDPLIFDYLKQPNCYFDKNFLYLNKPFFLTNNNFTPMSAIKCGILKARKRVSFGKKIPIKSLISSPIEKMSVSENFDLCIMINVIEHCYNLDLVFNKILSILKPGGIFVFHDKLYDGSYVAAESKFKFDAAHPLKPAKQKIEDFCSENFFPIYSHHKMYERYWLEEKISTDMLYFIGKRKN